MTRRLLIVSVAVALTATGASSQQWNLDSLPRYRPAQKVSGAVRNFGSGLGGLVKVWEEGFLKYQPDIRFEDKFPSSDGAVAGLISEVADLGTSGREPVLTEYLSFYETFNHDLVEVTVATGAYDIKGKTWAPVIYVNKDNPISKLTIKQLDGIFGSERTGGYRGFKWMPQAARSAKEDIRTWGQLGLTGEWAKKPIRTYGYAFTGMTNFFELKVFNGGEKWNPNYREYVEAGTKMVSEGDIGQTGSIDHMLAELSKDKYGMGWTGIPHAKNFAQVKALALAAQDGGLYVEPTRENVQNRTYPLTRSIYVFLNHAPGKPLEPKLKEFLRYLLSREGQQDVVRQGEYLPLTEEVVREQLKKVE